MKVAIVHEWLEKFAGSERVLEHVLACFPEADLFAVVDFMPESERKFLAGRAVTTSFIQRLPMARKRFRSYLALMPAAIEQLDLTGYDLVISSSHAVAKGVITGPNQVHVSYVHSPMRYAWDLQHQYLRQTGLDRGLKGMYARWLLHRLRIWDVRTANGVDLFIANSSYIARRISKVYHREAVVVHPPVAVHRFRATNERRSSYFVASRFVPYKRIDLIVEAFAALPDRRLLVVGEGPETDRVRRAAQGAANIEIRAPVSQEELVSLMQRARAFVFAAEEDFGITMAEAQACGTPVIAFGQGGARDIVVVEDQARPTGVLFPEQSAASIIGAVERFEAAESRFTPEACRANALRFSEERFRRNLLAVVDQAMAAHLRTLQQPVADYPVAPRHYAAE
jgi:glycosyltransferase involved in cell wall biosynthesis